MPSYKQHYRTKQDIQAEKNKNEQRVPLNSRIDIKAVAECLLYFDSQGVAISSRSELIACAVEGLASILRNNNKVVEIPTAEMAYREMYKRGIGWDKGTRSHRQVMNVLESESINLERFAPDDDAEEEMIRAYKETLRKMQDEAREKDKNAGRVAPMIPDNLRAPSPDK